MREQGGCALPPPCLLPTATRCRPAAAPAPGQPPSHLAPCPTPLAPRTLPPPRLSAQASACCLALAAPRQRWCSAPVLPPFPAGLAPGFDFPPDPSFRSAGKRVLSADSGLATVGGAALYGVVRAAQAQYQGAAPRINEMRIYALVTRHGGERRLSLPCSACCASLVLSGGCRAGVHLGGAAESAIGGVIPPGDRRRDATS